MEYLSDAISYLSDPINWSGPIGVGTLLIQHLWYSVLAVAISCLIAIPLGWFIGHTGRLRTLAVISTGAVRSLPTLGVITLLGLMLGIGLTAPMLAFIILAIPSILAGAYASIESVSVQAIDAARACGMTQWQILTRVEVPLGLPTLLGGIRSAMLQVISTATLAAYIGSGGLGRLVFLGLKTQRYEIMLAGSLLVIALAITSEIVFLIAQNLTRPPSARAVGKE